MRKTIIFIVSCILFSSLFPELSYAHSVRVRCFFIFCQQVNTVKYKKYRTHIHKQKIIKKTIIVKPKTIIVKPKTIIIKPNSTDTNFPWGLQIKPIEPLK